MVEAGYEADVEGKAHGCHMFTVDKFLADGAFDKCKGHVVLHGNEQDPEMYLDRSSPTVAVHSIFACLTAAAHAGFKEVAKIDVKGAFIQTPMEGPPVYMRCNKDLTKLIVEVYPKMQKFVSTAGCLYCPLLKALYGCVQASKLWFNKLVKFLRLEGYEQRPIPIDLCVMWKVVGDPVWLLLIYVDYILVIADKAKIERLKTRFTEEFTWNTIEEWQEALVFGDAD